METQSYLDRCRLFRGLSPEERTYALSYFSGREQDYRRGAFLHQVSFPLHHFGLVLAGTIQVYRDDMDGHHMIMNHVAPGETFGESYCFLGTDAPIYIQAVTDARVLWMHTNRLKTSPLCPLDQDLANRFTAMLAERTLSMNRRIQILSKLTLRGKLTAFLSQYAVSGEDVFTVPFDRASMADYLGTNRSALSRELSAMRREGILAYRKNQFRILKKPSL